MGLRYVMLRKEDTYGQQAANTMRFINSPASFKPNQNWIVPPSISYRAAYKRSLGPYRTRGTIGDFAVESENIGELLYAVLGGKAVANPEVGVYDHTFTPADTLPSYTVRLGVELTDRVLVGGLVESLNFRFKHDDDVKARAEIYSGFPETKTAQASLSLSTLQPLNMQDASSTLTIAGSNNRTLVYDAEINIKNNIPFARGALDSRNFTTKRVGQREVTGKLSLYFDTTTEYDRFIAGTEFELIIKAVGAQITGAYYHYLYLRLKKCVYLQESSPDVTPLNEPLVIDAPFKAFWDGSNECDAILRNTIASY